MDTVSKMRGPHPNSEMTFIGYLIAATLAIAMLPLLPVFLLYLVIDWFLSSGRQPGY